jgi:UDP-N-acetylmuramate--alanine ligase
LAQLGAHVSIGHRAENVRDAGVVVISSAVRPENPELQEARRRRIPVIPRAEMLGELMRGKTGIAVAGSHGKTTTTSMLATVLTVAGLDPTLVIGGKVDSLGGNAKLGQGQFVVAEADESDGSFLHLPATFGVVTNIDNDHLDHFGNMGAIEEAFVNFVGKLPFYGLAAVCAEDPGVRRCLSRFSKPFVSYGFSAEADYYAD